MSLHRLTYIKVSLPFLCCRKGEHIFAAMLSICLSVHTSHIFSSPGQSPGRAIVLPPASALALAAASALTKCLSFYVKVFYVMGKALSGELSCPCDRSCCQRHDSESIKGN